MKKICNSKCAVFPCEKTSTNTCTPCSDYVSTEDGYIPNGKTAWATTIRKVKDFQDETGITKIKEENNANRQNNQFSAKSDFGKAKLSLVPRRIIWDVAAIREFGNNKYPVGGPENWRKVEVERYRDAALRHFLRYLDDPYSVDVESGLPHLWHLACNIAFLCEMEDIHLSKNQDVVKKLKKKMEEWQ